MKVYEAIERDIEHGEEHTILVGVLTPNEMARLTEAGDGNNTTDTLIRELDPQ